MYNEYLKIDVYWKFILQYFIPPLGTGTNFLSPEKYSDELIIE